MYLRQILEVDSLLIPVASRESLHRNPNPGPSSPRQRWTPDRRLNLRDGRHCNLQPILLPPLLDSRLRSSALL